MPKRRKSTVHRVRHSRHRRAHRGVARLGAPKSLWGILGAVIPAIAFTEQITAKKRASYPDGSLMQRGQSTINNITGNMFGFNIFKGANVKSDFTQITNVAGIANKYTGIGIAGVVGKIVMKKTGVKIPMMNKLLTVASKMLPAGIVGGFFDDPPVSGQNYSNQVSFTAPRINNPNVQYAYGSSLN